MNSRYEFAKALAREAGGMILAAREKKIDVMAKGGDVKDIVTNVDIDISRYMSEKIAEDFPDDSIYSEEADADVSSGSFWSIDPIDGTAKFIRGIPHYSTVVAYVANGTPMVGVVYNPVTRELFSFEKGHGAFCGDKPVKVSTLTDLSKAHLFFRNGRNRSRLDWSARMHRFLLENAGNTSNFGSSSLDLCFVGAGRIEACIYGNATPIDMAAAIGFVMEAGGAVAGEKGAPCELSKKKQPVIAANSEAMIESILSGVPF